MGSFKEKYEANELIANELKENQHYSAATNRYYYATYQKLHDHASKHGYKEEKVNSVHKKIQIFLNAQIMELMSKIEDESLIGEYMQIQSIVSVFGNLKKLRVKADYGEDNITDDEIKRVIQYKENFDSYLKKLEIKLEKKEW